MAKIRPFQALHYPFNDSTPLADLVCPPYDVINPPLREKLLTQHPHNAIRLILGDPSELTEKELATYDRYESAKNILTQWRSAGTLVQDQEKGYYLLEDDFEWRGQRHQRLGILCTLHLGHTNQILSHEKTLSLPIEDRLQLMKATQAHLSPIYTLADDSQGSLLNCLQKLTKTKPLIEFENSNKETKHRVWFIQDNPNIQALTQALTPSSLLIADGHHRYQTALRFAQEEPQLSDEVNWGLVYIASSQDPGVVLTSIQRIFETEISVAQLLDQLSNRAEIHRIRNTWDEFENSKAPIALLSPDSNEAYTITPNEEELNQLPSQVRDLPSTLLDVWIVQRLLKLELSNPQHQKRVKYVKKPEEVTKWLQNEKKLGFWVKPLTASQVIQTSKTGELLPQKSTFFYPKVLTGIVFHSMI